MNERSTSPNAISESLETCRLRNLELEKALAESEARLKEFSSTHHTLDNRQEELQNLQNQLELEQATRQESEALLKRSAEIAGLGYALWDEVLDRDVTVSEELARIHGFTKEDYLSTMTSMEKYVEYVHPEDREAYCAHMADEESYENNIGIDYRFVTPDGVVRHLHDRSQYLTRDSGEPTLSIVVIQDITRRKLQEIELSEARREADEANRKKSSFLSTMSHEIRTPMNGVLAMADLVLDGELSDRQRKKVEIIRQSGDILLAILNDILDFSKIEAGLLDLEHIEFNLPDLIESVADMGTPQAQHKGLTIDVDTSEISHRGLVGDPIRIRQILNNLTNNAIKFTNHGSVTITVNQSDIGNGVIETRIEVADTGIGIRDGALESVFESFSQADASTARQYGGSGLGLAICKNLVELMGGAIGVQSRDPTGTLFWISIPLNTHLPDRQ